MSTETTTTTGARVITAFFDTAGSADRAEKDLIDAGIPGRHITKSGSGVTETAEPVEHRGFWESLKDLFLPDEDRYSYAEGLRRGGYLLRVETDEANYTRVADILDTDGAIDMDRREDEWRTSGWTGYPGSDPAIFAGDVPAAGLMGGTTLSAGANAPAIPSDSGRAAGGSPFDRASSSTAAPADVAPADAAWRADNTDKAGTLDRSTASTIAARDANLGRARLRGYVLDDDRSTMGLGRARSFSADIDASRILPHMSVISADGQTIGSVDHLDGPDRINREHV